jgi:hypothetical protein
MTKGNAFQVKRRFSLLLLLGALLGLLAQEAAFASAPALPMQEMTAATPAMSDECAEMMGIEASHDKKPCQGLTLDCIAKMGCAVPLAVPSTAAIIAATTYVRGLPDMLPTRCLVGVTTEPEPEPPLILG